ncbi:peptidoglycan-binding protein [Kitasatospora cineracea]|uniref:peptidoglycan-binding protein n=1 Tax=Kitasatospora cineracea TaxID=88074 RepID=UPI0036A8A491
MPNQYVEGAELHLLDTAPTEHSGGARAIWHITWDKNATAAAPADLVSFDNEVGYFSDGGRGEAPHLVWDPFSGRIAQFFPATSRSKSVVNLPGGVETNREGDICIQIETLFFPYCRVGGKVYATVADTPCKGLDRIMAWLRSWGVPDVWPMGAPTWASNRSFTVWASQSGHYGHSQVPENEHNDPGPMPNLFAVPATPASPPAVVPVPRRVRPRALRSIGV